MSQHMIYVYAWSCDDYHNSTMIRVYGIDKDGKNVALIISDFTPYVYIELPKTKDWESVLQELQCDLANKTLSTKVITKEHLYASKGDARCLFCQCASRMYILSIVNLLKQKTYRGCRLNIHEEGATSVLQMTSLRKIPMATWIEFKGIEVTNPKAKQTTCDREVNVSWRNLFPVEENAQVFPKIMAFDLEVNSDVMNAMPSNKPGDVIFQISCVIEKKQDRRKILLTLDGEDLTDDNPLLEGIEWKTFESEEELLAGFITLLRKERPNVLSGYNILGFDIMYLIKRCERYGMLEELQLAGFNKTVPAQQKMVKWSSSAYKNQEYAFIDWEGILILDLLPIIRRDYRLENYKLDTVASELIGAEKDPVGYKEIFLAYRTKKMARVGKYCVQDSNICIDLLRYTQCWTALAEMAVVCKVGMFSLYTQGQQMKIYNQVYSYCLHKNILVTSNGYPSSVGDQRYVGAYVMDPIPGYYENVCPLDFCSLYPSIIIAYNICYSTFVPENSKIPNDHYQIFEWEDHIACEHDPKIIEINKINNAIEKIETIIKHEMARRDEKGVKKETRQQIQKKINDLRAKQRPYRLRRTELKKGKPADREDEYGNIISGVLCCHHKYRFLKKEIKRGVIPTIIQNLLDSRKNVKKLMKDCSDPALRDVLDYQQKAFKISANSMYGAMGVRMHGKLPLPPGARCITYLGREAITKAGKIITEKYGGNWIYTDTDSTYVTFPHITDPQEIWDHAIEIAKKISSEFQGLTIEFENAVYRAFLIVRKKGYIYRAVDRDGISDGKIGKRGVVLIRRDNSKFMKTLYSKIVEMIFDGKKKKEIEIHIIEYISDMFRRAIPYDQYVITKSIGSTEGETDMGRLGDYKVKKLPVDRIEKEKALQGKTERQFFIDSCPHQVQLAEKMRLRGFPVDVGSRMEFVVLKPTKPMKKTTKLGGRIEDIDYFMKRKKVLEIDHLYYLKSLVNPVDQLLKVGIGCEGFIARQLLYRTNYLNVIDELKKIFSPIIIKS